MDPAFLDRLPADGMRRMLRHWDTARGSEAIPRRPPFNPLLLPEQLGLIQLHERKSNGRFLCRVSGTAIVEAFGFESTGRHVDETVNPADLESRIAILNEALETGSPILYSGRLAIQLCGWKGVQRLIMPFADANGERRFILSMLHFMKQPPSGTNSHGIAMKLAAFSPARQIA